MSSEIALKTGVNVKAVALLALATAGVVAAVMFLGNSSSAPQATVSGGTSSTTAANADFGACKDDVASYCAGFNSTSWQSYAVANGYTSASWKLGLVDCLNKHSSQISEACNASLVRRQTLNEAVNAACATDRATYCSGVVPSPGSEPQVDCLMSHRSEVSTECGAALDAHEAAKPASR